MEQAQQQPQQQQQQQTTAAPPTGTPQSVSPLGSPSKSTDKCTYKIILIGSAAVGKTNLLSVAARGQQFDAKSPPTLQPEFATVKIPRPDWKYGQPNQHLTAQIWDTAGQERYQAISSSHYRRAHGALIVFDVTNKASFKDIYPGTQGGTQWLKALKDNVDQSLLGAVMLVENKIDKIDKKIARPATFVQEQDVKNVLSEVVFKDPKQGLGWLYDGDPQETTPFKLANSLMYAKTSALTNACELFELAEKPAPASDLLKKTHKPVLEYEKTLGVNTVSKAIEALILRIYARTKDMDAGGSKPSGMPFKLHEKQAEAPKNEPIPESCLC